MAESIFDKDLQDIAANFSASFDFLNKEIERNALNETLNETLALTDELQTLTEIVNADTRVSNAAIEQFAERCPQIEDLFKKIDQLEAFVNDVKEGVKNINTALSKAESDLSKK